MSYFIVRNEKYKQNNLLKVYEHNHRKNSCYKNKNIDKEKTEQNYYLKECSQNYLSEIKKLKKDNELKGQLQKTSNIACELIVTSDNTFFSELNEKEQQQFFLNAYNFVSTKIYGEKNIVDAVVHLDEKTPHMHLVYMPVVEIENNKTLKKELKLSCSSFWQGHNSYGNFQDEIYEFMKGYGYKLERGIKGSVAKNLKIEQLKELTDYDKKLDISKDINNIEKLEDSIYSAEIIENKGLKKGTYDKIVVDNIIKQFRYINKSKDDIINKLVVSKTNIKQKELINKITALESKLDYNKFELKELGQENRDLRIKNKLLSKENNKLQIMITFIINRFKELINMVKETVVKFVTPEKQEIENNKIEKFVDITNNKLEDIENEKDTKRQHAKDIDYEHEM